jgi:hypothetical protein
MIPGYTLYTLVLKLLIVVNFSWQTTSTFELKPFRYHSKMEFERRNLYSNGLYHKNSIQVQVLNGRKSTNYDRAFSESFIYQF